jgi:hypothetical protein
VLVAVENAVKVEPVGEFELKGIRRPLAGVQRACRDDMNRGVRRVVMDAASAAASFNGTRLANCFCYWSVVTGSVFLMRTSDKASRAASCVTAKTRAAALVFSKL